MKGFEGKVAFVTGAAQGIGYTIAKRFVEEGVKSLAVVDWNLEQAQKAADELNALGTTKAIAVKCDVASPENVHEAFEMIRNELGPVDILVNNAGIIRDAMFHKMGFEAWDRVLKVNLYGVYNCTQEVIGSMRQRGYGRIVSMSSSSAYGAVGQTNYAATKAGVIGFTKSLAKESARKGITVNAVAPDFIDTPMVRSMPEDVMKATLERVPMQRMGTPEEVAGLVAYLCSEDASYVTGTCIDCSGADRT